MPEGTGEKYANLITTITNCDFRMYISSLNDECYNPDKVEYTFFIVANILLSIYRDRYEVDEDVLKNEKVIIKKDQEKNAMKK